jgi:sodium/bile acid cotransporter 7
MKRLLVRHWFLIGLGLVLAAGFSQPRLTSQIARVEFQDWVVAAVLFVMALPLDSSSMWRAIRRPTAVAVAVGVNYGLLPLVAWGVSFGLRTDLALGLLIVASIPTTQASCAVWTRRAGGNDAVAVMVTVITNAFCFLLAPFWLKTMTGSQVDIDFKPLEMMGELSTVVVLPMIVAQLARLIRPLGRWATHRKTPLNVAAQMGLLVMVLIGAGQAGLKLQSTRVPIEAVDAALMLASVCGVHLSMFAAGMGIGRALGVPWEDRVAIGFSGSQKTLMIGLHIALSPAFNNGLAMLPMVAYHVCQLLVDAVIADKFKARSLAHSSPQTGKTSQRHDN